MKVVNTPYFHTIDFDFNGCRSSPPPSPKRFGEYYCSAPVIPSLRHFPSSFPADPSPEQHNSKSICSSASMKKWRLKELFLFRGSSWAAGKDPLRKHTVALRRWGRGGPISAHELHYRVNRAVSEELKKKTFLPYKQGIVGRVAINPAVHALSNGFGFPRK